MNHGHWPAVSLYSKLLQVLGIEILEHPPTDVCLSRCMSYYTLELSLKFVTADSLVNLLCSDTSIRLLFCLCNVAHTG